MHYKNILLNNSSLNYFILFYLFILDFIFILNSILLCFILLQKVLRITEPTSLTLRWMTMKTAWQSKTITVLTNSLTVNWRTYNNLNNLMNLEFTRFQNFPKQDMNYFTYLQYKDCWLFLCWESRFHPLAVSPAGLHRKLRWLPQNKLNKFCVLNFDSFNYAASYQLKNLTPLNRYPASSKSAMKKKH